MALSTQPEAITSLVQRATRATLAASPQADMKPCSALQEHCPACRIQGSLQGARDMHRCHEMARHPKSGGTG